MENKKTETFEILNTTPTMGEFKLTKPEEEYTGFDKNYLILDMGEKTKQDITTCNFMFKSDTYKITSTGASCGCTNPSFQNTEEGQFVTVQFKSSLITKNVDKWFTLYLNNSEKKIKINLWINKSL